jgi:Tol biopolymer transport system component
LNIRSLETGKDRVLLPKLQMFLWPRWAGDSLSLLVFGTDFKGGRGMYRVDALTGETTPLLPPDSKFGAMHAFVSRDGKRLFYLRAGQGTNTAIVRDLATGQEKELYQDAKLNTLELSPDGSQLVVLSYDAKDRASLLILVPAEGGEARELLRTQYPQGIPGFETPGFSADGRFVVFFKQNSGTPPAGPPPAKEMWRIPVTGGELQKLDVGMQTHNVRFHPDGRRIAFTYGQYANEVWVMENFLPAPKASK